MTWNTYQLPYPNRRMFAVRHVTDGEYLEGNYEDAFYAAGIPHWKQKDAETVVTWLNDLERTRQ